MRAYRQKPWLFFFTLAILTGFLIGTSAGVTMAGGEEDQEETGGETAGGPGGGPGGQEE